MALYQIAVSAVSSLDEGLRLVQEYKERSPATCTILEVTSQNAIWFHVVEKEGLAWSTNVMDKLRNAKMLRFEGCTFKDLL